MQVTLPDFAASERFGAVIASLLELGDVVLLEGELGAGKTFIAGAIARGLGLPDDIPVTSPTFALVHEYPEARVPLLHADLYRLGDAAELEELGLPDREGAFVCVIEWGERFMDVLGEPALFVRLGFGPDENARLADLSGTKAAQVAERMQ